VAGVRGIIAKAMYGYIERLPNISRGNRLTSPVESNLQKRLREMPTEFREKFYADSLVVREYIGRWLEKTTDKRINAYAFVKKEAKKSIIDEGWGLKAGPQDALIKALEPILPAYKWKKEYKFLSHRHQKIDLAGRPIAPPGPEIWIELERDRHTCVRNVVKVWQGLASTLPKRTVLLIQIFSPLYGAGEENHLFSIESEFIGKRAENDPNVNLKFEPHVTAGWPLLSPNGFNGLAEDIKSIAAKYGY